MKKYLLAVLVLILSILACGLPTGSVDAPTPNPLAPTSNLPPSASSPDTSGQADVIFINGIILTMDDYNPAAQAVAIQGNRIIAVGATEEILRQHGDATNVIDLEGRALVPGFTDSHQHRILNALEGKSNLDKNLRDAITQGWTTLNELYVTPEFMPLYTALDRQGSFRLRVNIYPAINTSWGAPLDEWYATYRPGQDFRGRLRIAGLKVFTDVDNATILIWGQDGLNATLLKMYKSGWPLAVKSVSTRSLEMILIAVESIHQADPNVANHRIRIEHALFLTPDQISRVKRFGMIPSIQTSMPGSLMGSPDLEALLPYEPAGSAFPWRSLAESNVIFVNGSAWPTLYVDEPTGAPFGSPIHLIYQAVTRVGNLGAQPETWMLDQTITAEQAMRALTIDAAYADFQEDVLGSITPGKLADMVILSDNPLAVSAAEINNIQVLMTMIDGQVEYCSDGYEALCPFALVAADTDPFVGNWTSVDPLDGSRMSLQIIRDGGHYVVTLVDELASICGLDETGNAKFALEAVTSGTVNGNVLTTTITSLTCLSDPPQILERTIPIDYTYQSETDSLSDNSQGAVWIRE